MIVGSPAERPAEVAVGLPDRQIVDRREAPLHEAGRVEFPVLVPVGAEPVAAVVVPFVGESHRYAVAFERPQLLDQAVVRLLRPLAGEELDDLSAADRKLGAVAPS